MIYRVTVSEDAEADLEAALRRFLVLSKIDPVTVFEWVNRLRETFQSLTHFPYRNALAEEPKLQEKTIREYTFGKRRGAWRILYRVEDDLVTIARVIRGARGPLRPEDLA